MVRGYALSFEFGVSPRSRNSKPEALSFRFMIVVKDSRALCVQREFHT